MVNRRYGGLAWSPLGTFNLRIGSQPLILVLIVSLVLFETHIVFFYFQGECGEIHSGHFLHQRQELSEQSPFLSIAENAEKKVQSSPVENDSPRPNWKVSTDCSIFALDCQIQRKYAPYPFDFWNTSSFPEMDVKDLTNMLQTQRKNNSIAEALENQLPQPVSKDEEEECLKYSKETPFNRQLDEMLKKLSRSSSNALVAYTMSDIGYAKEMIHDVFAMAHNVVGFPNSFFMVAIDDATLELGCRYNYPILPSPHSGGLEERVKFTKFQVSLDLLRLGQNFLFFEMDVWFFRSMLPFLQNQFGDILVSSHQNNPLQMNIGVYSVSANDATCEYFQHCLDVAAKVDIHDQLLMQHLNIVSGYQERGTIAPPKFPNVTFQHYIHIETLGANEISASEWPRLTVDTIAIHPLATVPLTGSHGKIQIAKELGVYYGSHGYYSSEGRYLWLDRSDNSYSMVLNFQHKDWGLYHDGQAMKWTIATLIAIAKKTNRIWVLPKIQADIGRHFLWRLLDLKTVEELGVEVRETNFLSNPKLSNFPSVSRTAVGEGKMFWQEDDKVPYVWKIDEDDQMDTWFSLLTRIESKALLVNPHVVGTKWQDRFLVQQSKVEMELTPMEEEIYKVYRILKWCNFDCRTKAGKNCWEDWSSEIWNQQRLSGARAIHDCYGKGILTG